MMLPLPSPEQQHILLKMSNSDCNIVVDAVAGSGKSTLVLQAARQMPHIRFLQVTFNALLRHEMKELAHAHRLHNLEIHTFHSLAVKYYNMRGHTDHALRTLLNNAPPPPDRAKFDWLVIDENQDMSLLYYRFMWQFGMESTNTKRFRLLVLGDFCQGIYEFKGADSRFLTRAQEIWAAHPRLQSPMFLLCSLHTSYRLTHSVAWFVNNVLLQGTNRLQAIKSGRPVTFFIGNSDAAADKVFQFITDRLTTGFCPGDFFVLAASVKPHKNRTVRKVENALARFRVPCYVPPVNDHRFVDERILQNKVVFSTFHAAKGRQRKFVVVLGFDANYFRFYNRTADTKFCPNTLYVACTRCTDEMLLIEEGAPLPFLTSATSPEHLEIIGRRHHIQQKQTQPQTFNAEQHKTTTTELATFLPDMFLHHMHDRILAAFTEVNVNNNCRNNNMSNTIIWESMPFVIRTRRGLFEESRELNRLCLLHLFLDFGSAAVPPPLLFDPAKSSLVRMLGRSAAARCCCPAEQTLLLSWEAAARLYLRLSAILLSTQEELLYRLDQFVPDEMNWLTESIVSAKMLWLQSLIPHEAVHATVVATAITAETKQVEVELQNHIIQIDAVATPICSSYGGVWEFECDEKISMESRVSIILQQFVRGNDDNGENVYGIANLSTQQALRLTANQQEINAIVTDLLRVRFVANEIDTATAEFFSLI